MRLAWLFSALVFAAAGAALAADQGSRVAGNTYDWSLAVGAGQCEETWAFGEDGVLTVTSGQEVTTSAYTLARSGDASMHLLESRRLTSNGLPDCQGDANASVGGARQVYLVFLNGGGFFTCANTDTMSCYGVATPRR